MRKESKLFFSFPRRSNFGEAKVTKILSKREEKKTVSFLEREEFIKKISTCQTFGGDNKRYCYFYIKAFPHGGISSER